MSGLTWPSVGWVITCTRASGFALHGDLADVKPRDTPSIRQGHRLKDDASKSMKTFIYWDTMSSSR